MKICQTVIAAAMFMLIVCSAATAEIKDRIVAVVNDEVITLSELNRAFEPYARNIAENYQGPDKEKVIRQNREAMLQRLIEQILIEQEAKKSGGLIAAVSDDEVMKTIEGMLARNKMSMDDYKKKLAADGGSLDTVKKEIRDQMLRMRVLRREVQSKIVVTDEAIGEYYDQHRQDYEGKEASRIKLILIPAPADATGREDARRLAKEVRERIIKGEPFEMLAAQYSRGPAAAQGGDIGFIEKGVILPDVEKAAFTLPVGQISEVIEAEQGFYIIAVKDRRGAGLKPLTEVRNEIKAKIEEGLLSKKYEEWIESVRKKSFIDIRL